MDVFHQVVTMLITLSVLIAFHEYGHFIVARWCDVKVLKFSIGFGPVIYSFRDKKNTEFAFSLLPLGGFVKMLDEREGDVEESELNQAFNRKPVLQRMAIVSAGPIFNFVLAVLVYWVVFLGGTTTLKAEVFHIEADSIAQKSGFTAGSTIIAVDGVKVISAQQVMMELLKRIGGSGDIVLATDSSEYHLEIERWLSDQEGDVDVLQSLGIRFYMPEIKPLIETVLESSPADHAGLQSGDFLLEMDGQAIEDWSKWVEYVRKRPNEAIQLTYLRAQQQQSVVITPALVRRGGKGFGQVGVMVAIPSVPEHLLIKQEYNIVTAIPVALQRTWQAAAFSLSSVKKLIIGELSYKQLSGPISIAKVASESVQSGIYSYLSLLALLSVSLGVLNLLPIPVLDGGHLLFYLVEWVKGSPVPEKIQIVAFQAGVVVVLSIMVLAVVNDISRL